MEQKMGATMRAALEMQGIDTRQPFMFDFFFYLPTQADAEALANELRAKGYLAEVQPGPSDDTFSCLANRVLVPEEAAMNYLGDTFNALAAKYHGDFDGWGTPVD